MIQASLNLPEIVQGNRRDQGEKRYLAGTKRAQNNATKPPTDGSFRLLCR